MSLHDIRGHACCSFQDACCWRVHIFACVAAVLLLWLAQPCMVNTIMTRLLSSSPHLLLAMLLRREPSMPCWEGSEVSDPMLPRDMPKPRLDLPLGEGPSKLCRDLASSTCCLDLPYIAAQRSAADVQPVVHWQLGKQHHQHSNCTRMGLWTSRSMWA